MSTPKPITLTSVATEDYEGKNAPQPFVVVGDLPVVTEDTAGAIVQADAIADIATANGSDAATTQALANATKATVNTILAALRTAGVIAEA